MNLDINGREAGKRVIIGGYSPHIHELPKEFLETGAVIGINRWGAEYHCDYWLGLDTGLNWEKYVLDTNDAFANEPKFLQKLQCPKFMRRPNEYTETFVPDDAGIFFDRAPIDELSTVWNGRLRWDSSSALAAIHLAIIMGASEVVLYGVDFVGDERADGSEYTADSFWGQHATSINRLLAEFQEHVPIYKLHPDSWLECPLMVI